MQAGTLQEAAVAKQVMNGERLFTFPEIAKRAGVPGHRGKPHQSPSTYFRWATKGAKCPNGETIRLAAIRCGSRWTTSIEAVNRFLEAVTAASTPTAPCEESQGAVLSRTSRNREADAAADELDRLLG